MTRHISRMRLLCQIGSRRTDSAVSRSNTITASAPRAPFFVPPKVTASTPIAEVTAPSDTPRDAAALAALTDDAPSATETVTYSYLDGAATELPLTIEMGAAFIDPSEVHMTLGTGEIADELRSLGLPCAPDMAVYGEELSGTFLPPRSV